MGDIQLKCALPPSILERIGSILFVRADSATKTSLQVGALATFDDARYYLQSMLRHNASLFLVFYSSTLSVNEIEAARRQLPEHLQCRVIGSMSYLDSAVAIMVSACKTWASKFAPHLPFVILDNVMVQKMNFIDRKSKEHNRSSRIEVTLKSIVGLPISPVPNRPLCSIETVKLALDLYMNGLPSLAYKLKKPLLNYWQLSDPPASENASIIFGFGRGSAGQFGELCRRLNVRPMSQVIFNSARRHSRYDNV